MEPRTITGTSARCRPNQPAVLTVAGSGGPARSSGSAGGAGWKYSCFIPSVYRTCGSAFVPASPNDDEPDPHPVFAR